MNLYDFKEGDYIIQEPDFGDRFAIVNIFRVGMGRLHVLGGTRSEPFIYFRVMSWRLATNEEIAKKVAQHLT